MTLRVEKFVESDPEKELLANEIVEGLPCLTLVQLKGLVQIIRLRRESIEESEAPYA
jgi:hypothetical protein